MPINNIVLPSEVITFDEDQFDLENVVMQRKFLLRYLDGLVLDKNMTLREAITLYYIFEESSWEDNDSMLQALEIEINKKSSLKNLLIDNIFLELDKQDQVVATDQLYKELVEDDEDPKEFYETLMLLYDGQIPPEVQKQYNEYAGNSRNSEAMALDTLSQALQYKVKSSVNKPLTVEELISKVERSRGAKKLEKQQVAQAVSTITAVSSKPKAPSNLNNLN